MLFKRHHDNGRGPGLGGKRGPGPASQTHAGRAIARTRDREETQAFARRYGARVTPESVTTRTFPTALRAWLTVDATLAATVSNAARSPPGEDPFSGVVIVFRAKRADRLKILVWDTNGLVLIWKQLQQSTFRWPPVMDGVMKLSAIEFAALFSGLDWTRVQAIKEVHKPTVAA